MRIFALITPPSREERHRARIWAAGSVGVLALLMLILLMSARPPEEADLAPPALHTAQITVFQDDVAACRAALEGAGFETVRLPDRDEGRCGYADAVELTQSVHAYSQSVATTCAVAAALVLWERDVVSRAAQRRFGQAVSRIELAGSAYSCRPIAGRRDGRLSEHASANAVDIGGFVLANGRRVEVAAGWRGSQAERAFLRDVRDGACDYFQAVLSPDYNEAHRDHLHFDLGRDDMCR